MVASATGEDDGGDKVVADAPQHKDDVRTLEFFADKYAIRNTTMIPQIVCVGPGAVDECPTYIRCAKTATMVTLVFEFPYRWMCSTSLPFQISCEATDKGEINRDTCYIRVSLLSGIMLIDLLDTVMGVLIVMCLICAVYMCLRRHNSVRAARRDAAILRASHLASNYSSTPTAVHPSGYPNQLFRDETADEAAKYANDLPPSYSQVMAQQQQLSQQQQSSPPERPPSIVPQQTTPEQQQQQRSLSQQEQSQSAPEASTSQPQSPQEGTSRQTKPSDPSESTDSPPPPPYRAS